MHIREVRQAKQMIMNDFMFLLVKLNGGVYSTVKHLIGKNLC
jgi:hypothetical protein